MLKETYSKISFPLEKKDPSSVLATYTAEFGIKEIDNYSNISVMFAHALRDYLKRDIDEWAFGSLCFSLATNKKSKNILRSKNTKLKTYILDCVDILWLSEGENFSKYKEELTSYLAELETEISKD